VLLSRFAHNVAVYGGLVASVASAWVAIRHRERRVEPKLPPATTGRSVRRYLARIAPVVVLIAVLGGEWALLSHAHDAVVVDAGPTAAREVFVGSVPDASTIFGTGDTLVINHSAGSLTFVEIDYDDYQPRELAPGTVTLTPHVQFLGPDHQPPSDPAAEGRTWLTWD
jgi:hypothetical protein